MEKMNFDFIIIGSGFGGSVSAMRLSQKGYKVAVLEKGTDFKDIRQFAKTNWNIKKFLWAPIIRCFGIQQITLLKGVMVLHGSGVGGGSLVYANTLMKPADKVFKDRAWPEKISDWLSELNPHYDVAKKMLGVTRNPILAESDVALKKVGERMNISETFHATDVGVYFGRPGQAVSDPFFNGQGPERVGCTGCGACMIGCRVGAKNTLDKNYLFFALKWGAQIFSRTKVTEIIPLQEGYQVIAHGHRNVFSSHKIVFGAKRVILAAGVLGTVDLLFRNKEKHNHLPLLSEALGENVRTNGESLCGVTSFEAHRDLSRGIAIGSAIHPDENTKIESVRYPAGSTLMRLLAVPLTDDGGKWKRPLKLMITLVRKSPQMIRLALVKDWAKSSVILLVMQTIDHKMKLKLGSLGLQGVATDKPVPSFLPVAQIATKLMAEEINGVPQNVVSEVVLGTPATAHILGGCNMGDTQSSGVIDLNHEVFNYPGLYVCDGSVVPVNLGVNPSLTITALAERFASQFPPNSDLSSAEFEKREIVFTEG